MLCGLNDYTPEGHNKLYGIKFSDWISVKCYMEALGFFEKDVDSFLTYVESLRKEGFGKKAAQTKLEAIKNILEI